MNRSIGTTVQPTYYRERLHEAATGTEDTKQEVLTKDFNMWQTGKVTKWITGDRIRLLQKTEGRRIDDCKFIDDGKAASGGTYSVEWIFHLEMTSLRSPIWQWIGCRATR